MTPKDSPATSVPKLKRTGPRSSPALSQQEVEAIGEAILKLAQEPGVREMLSNIAVGIQKLANELRPILAFAGTLLQGAGTIMATLPGQLQKAVLALTGRGWFYDHEADFSDYWRAEALVSEGNFAGADALMVAHFEKRLPAIEEALCVHLPHRSAKIRNALKAHRRGEFDLSILALLAQADGVCNELRGGHFFMMDRATRLPQAAVYARGKASNSLQEILHMGLIAQSPLKHQLSKRSTLDAGVLNRHAAMHGESLDFDTSANSLRALSLLNYVALALDAHEPDKTATFTTMIVRTAASATPASAPRGT